jgi:hypothetical protein
MTGLSAVMVDQCLDLCVANFPRDRNLEVTETTGLWLKMFGKIQDDLFYTAITLCLSNSKTFPTVADIKQAIRELQWEETTKPKQLEHRSNWQEPLAAKAFKMVADGQAKKFLQEVDIGDLVEYARQYFPDISEDSVRKNLPELYQGQESQDCCFSCRISSINDCITKGFVVKHWMEKDGRITNQMLKCQKTH